MNPPLTPPPVPMHPNKRDRTQVETLSGMGASPEFIASHLSLTTDQLSHHYQRELDHGSEEANLRVAETFFDMATSGDYPQATIAWLKMRAPQIWNEAPVTPVEEDTSDAEMAKEKLLKLLNRGR